MGIYGAGKAFNLRYAQNTYVPNRSKNVPTRQPIKFGGHSHCATTNTNITINNGPTGFWGFMSGVIGGLFGGGGGLFGGLFSNLLGGGMSGYSPFGMINAQQAQPQQLPGNQDKLANLKTLYPNHNIVSDGNGKYSATDKDGNLIGQGLSYENMCEALSKAKTEDKVKVDNDNDDDDDGGKIKNNDDDKVKNDDAGKVKNDDDDGSKVKDNNGTRRTGGGNKAGGSKKADGSQGAGGKQWTDAEKAKPRRLNMTMRITSSGAGSATVVTPDGKTYKVSTEMSMTYKAAINDLSSKMQSALKQAGWTNVTLENQNFNWSSDGSKAVGNVEKPNGGKQWSAQDKANYNKPMTISFAVHSGGGIGNSGSATVTTPDGQLHQVSTGVSLTAARARKDLANKMIELLHQRGWTNAQLQNNNFNDWQ